MAKIKKSPKNTYEDYKRKFYTNREKLKQRGQEMFDNYVLSKVEWEALAKAHENTMKREIAKGERKEIGDINAIIVRQQTYEYSQRQAEVYRRELMRAGEAYRTIEEVMLGKFSKVALDDFYEKLEEEYREYVAAGVSGKTAKLAISHKYFGSN